MLEDFEEFLNSSYQHQEYYLGTILLHAEKENNRCNIIDGQQRITSLLLMLKACDHRSFSDIEYDNPRSQEKIRENYETINELFKREKYKDLIKNIFSKIVFTVIETDNVDDAFTFFDTQNSRGVQPSVLVLLKSFNLRAISKSDFELQETCASKWEHHEKAQNNQRHLSEEADKLEWLIKVFFYRVRNWRSNKNADFGSYDSFRDQFTTNLRVSGNEGFNKYPSFKNKLSSKSIDEVKDQDFFTFAVRQPLHQGEGFFMFVDYYASLLDELMTLEINAEKKFQVLVNVHKTGSRYIASFFTVVVLTYYDRFGKEGLSKFIKLFDVLVANVRLRQGRILKQTMEIQFIRCEHEKVKQNILDFICGSFDVQEVIDGIEEEDREPYKEEGVQGKFSNKHKEFWKNN